MKLGWLKFSFSLLQPCMYGGCSIRVWKGLLSWIWGYFLLRVARGTGRISLWRLIKRGCKWLIWVVDACRDSMHKVSWKLRSCRKDQQKCKNKSKLLKTPSFLKICFLCITLPLPPFGSWSHLWFVYLIVEATISVHRKIPPSIEFLVLKKEQTTGQISELNYGYH